MQFDQRDKKIIPFATSWQQLYQISLHALEDNNTLQIWHLLSPAKKKELQKIVQSFPLMDETLRHKILPPSKNQESAMANISALKLLAQYLSYGNHALRSILFAQSANNNCRIIFSDPTTIHSKYNYLILSCFNQKPLYLTQQQNKWYLHFYHW